MEIKLIRINNLKTILEDDFKGEKASLARAMGVSPNNISRYFNTSTNGRAISDDAARLIEQVTGRSTGWMDLIHNGSTDEKLLKLAEITYGLSDSGLKEIEEYARLVQRREKGEF